MTRLESKFWLSVIILLGVGAIWAVQAWHANSLRLREGLPISAELDLGEIAQNPLYGSKGRTDFVNVYIVFDYLCPFSRGCARDLEAIQDQLPSNMRVFLVQSPLHEKSKDYSRLSIAAAQTGDSRIYRRIHSRLLLLSTIDSDPRQDPLIAKLLKIRQHSREVEQRLSSEAKLAVAAIGKRTPAIIVQQPNQNAYLYSWFSFRALVGSRLTAKNASTCR